MAGTLRALSRAVSGLAVVTLASAAPAAAAEPLLTTAAQAQVDRLDTTKATQSPTPANDGKSDAHRSFFKTPKGVVATVLLAGLAGYTIHSRIADAVHSPAR